MTKHYGDPTPEEIRQWCEFFQSTWTAKERTNRRLRCRDNNFGQVNEYPLEIPVIPTINFRTRKRNAD